MIISWGNGWKFSPGSGRDERDKNFKNLGVKLIKEEKVQEIFGDAKFDK